MKLNGIDILACPLCKSELKIRVLRCAGDDILKGTLRCPICGNKYEIKYGIPRLIPYKVLKKRLYNIINRYYDVYAPVYDYRLSNPEIEYVRNVEREIILSTVPKGIVLDIGCGTGAQTLLLASLGCRVFALDISMNMLLETLRKARALNLVNNIELIQASADYLPFKNASFDRVYSLFGTLNHVPAYISCFTQIHDILKAGGKLLISIQNLYKYQLIWWINFILYGRKSIGYRKSLHQRTCFFPVIRDKRGRRHRTWTRLFSYSEIKKILQDVGFRDVKIGSLLIFVRPRFKHSPERNLQGIKKLFALAEDIVRWIPPFNRLGVYLIVLANR